MNMNIDIDIEDYSSYKIITISNICENNLCLCKHQVTIEKDNVKFDGYMNGSIIAKYYKYHKMVIPIHYIDFISYHGGLN